MSTAKAEATKEATVTRRVFMYNGAALEDPDAAMKEADVKKYYESAFPELTTADLSINIKDGVKTVIFQKRAGTKG